MSTFLYFVENLRGLQDPEELGIGYALEAAHTAALDVAGGGMPGSGSGVLLFDRDRIGGANPAPRPDQQAWRKHPAAPGVWVGCYTAPPHRPTAKTLARRTTHRGKPVSLRDGGEWLVPELMVFDTDLGYQLALPCLAEIDERGEWVLGELSEEHRRLAEIASRLVEGCLWAEVPPESRPPEAAAAKPISDREYLDLAAELLAVNHAVGRLELVMLGVLEVGPPLLEIARAAIAWDDIEAERAGNSPAPDA